MGFRLVPKSVTLNDLERHNDPYFALFRQIRYSFRGPLRKVGPENYTEAFSREMS